MALIENGKTLKVYTIPDEEQGFKKGEESNWGINVKKFASINRMIMRDLNARRQVSPSFYRYSREDIQGFLKDPYTNEKKLRDAVVYLYGVSSHFKRLIQYFASLSDLSYVVSPYKIDTAAVSADRVRRNYRKVLNLLSSMDIKNAFPKILTVCLREDVFYGTIWESSENTLIQQLPSDQCKIAVIEDGVANVSFDFSYFQSNEELLALYPSEFSVKYDLYKTDMTAYRWQELDAPNSFAIKYNKDVWTYALPPFAGILREIYDLEDYKQMRLTKTEIDNYAMLAMTIPLNSDGSYGIDLKQAKDFWGNLDSVLPDEIGSVVSPMPIQKISFERTHPGETDTIAQAEQNLFTAAGVSSLLFNNEKAAASALLLSIKSDQSMTYSIVQSIETMLNRFLHRHSYGKAFKVTFLDSSPYNRQEVGDAYLKACQYGLPMTLHYCASQGLMPDEVDSLNFLEDSVLKLKDRFQPLMSSATMSGKTSSADAGRPEKSANEITESGERWRDEN